MKPTLFLRIASILTFIHAVLHTFGGVFGAIDPGPATVAATAMKVNHVLVMGSMRSFWDFYRGMGLAVTIALTAEAVLFWQLGSLARTDARRLRPIIATFALAYAIFAADSFVYFFAPPVITESLIAISLLLAIVTTPPASAAAD